MLNEAPPLWGCHVENVSLSVYTHLTDAFIIPIFNKVYLMLYYLYNASVLNISCRKTYKRIFKAFSVLETGSLTDQ